MIDIRLVDDNLVRVLTHDETFEARLVLTVGAWTEKLLKSVTALPRLVVTQERMPRPPTKPSSSTAPYQSDVPHISCALSEHLPELRVGGMRQAQ